MRFVPTSNRTGDCKIRLTNVSGIEYSVDLSTLLFLPLLLLTLRYKTLPYFYSSFQSGTYWLMASVITAGFAILLLLHQKILLTLNMRTPKKAKSLCLHPFGSVTSFEISPLDRESRMKLSLAGIFLCYAFVALFYALTFLSDVYANPQWITGIFFHLACASTSLAILQSLPILPLDAGRLLLSYLSREGHVRESTLTLVYFLGHAFVIGFLILGVSQGLQSRVVLGAWILAIGLLLYRANSAEYTAVRGDAMKQPER